MFLIRRRNSHLLNISPKLKAKSLSSISQCEKLGMESNINTNGANKNMNSIAFKCMNKGCRLNFHSDLVATTQQETKFSQLEHKDAFSETKCGNFFTRSREEWHQFFRKRQEFGVLGVNRFQFLDIERGRLCAKMEIERQHMAPNGYLHAASVILLADTACGFGCFAHLPSPNHLFTTAELKSNFISSAKEGDTVYVEATLSHAGNTTQVWDAKVYNISQEKSPKLMAMFRCTQIILSGHNSQTKVHQSNDFLHPKS